MSTSAPDPPSDARDFRPPPQLALRFENDRLMLGATTRALVKHGGFDEARVTALLTAAYGGVLPPSAPRYLKGAVEKQHEGQTALALTCLALAGPPKLADPTEAAWRLSAADGLMKSGVTPATIIEALRSNGALIERAYNPDQPRVPAGNPDGGQWTSGDLGAGDGERSPRQPAGAPGADGSTTPAQNAGSDPPPTATTSTPAPSNETILAQHDSQTCQSYIAANCKAGILRVFPGQFLACTLAEVKAAAKAGDAAARTACKLLFKNEYQK